ncbi:MAG: hypothetical protein H6711_04030 [Myxococcales bacterium]|nr:hypothetical protein [Myxococcales bacterium]
MSVASALLALVVAVAAAAPDDAASSAGVAIDAMALAVDGIDRGALVAALELRAPDIEVRAAEAACGDGCVAVVVSRGVDAAITIEARAVDGRVFTRSLGAVAEGERAVATSLANLIEAIVEGRAPPSDSTDPTADDAATPPTDEREASPPASAPETATPAPESAPRTLDDSGPPAPRFELGVTLGLAAAFGVGPPRALAGRVGSGFAAAFDVRAANGALGRVGLRALEARESGHRLERVRIAVGGGYSLRRGRFEMPAIASLTIEPWWVVARADGARASGGAPLLGGALSLAPGVGAALGPDLRVRVGLRLEGAVSVYAADGGVVQATDAGGEPLFRLGGGELGVMAELGLAWGRARSGRGAR